MQAAMDRLESFVSRRRRLVLGIWAVMLLASLPFAAQQTKHLTAGGFEVPGSQSLTAADLLKRFPGVQTQPLIFVFDNSTRNATALSAAVGTAVGATHGVEGLTASPAAIQNAKAHGTDPIVLLPLTVTGTVDESADA